MELRDAIRDFQLFPPIDPRMSEERSMAPRLATLRGMRVGLLDNRKSNANVLLGEMGRLLSDHHGVAEVHMVEKPIFSRPAPHELLSRLEEFDLVLTAIGD